MHEALQDVSIHSIRGLVLLTGVLKIGVYETVDFVRSDVERGCDGHC